MKKAVCTGLGIALSLSMVTPAVAYAGDQSLTQGFEVLDDSSSEVVLLSYADSRDALSIDDRFIFADDTATVVTEDNSFSFSPIKNGSVEISRSGFDSVASSVGADRSTFLDAVTAALNGSESDSSVSYNAMAESDILLISNEVSLLRVEAGGFYYVAQTEYSISVPSGGYVDYLDSSDGSENCLVVYDGSGAAVGGIKLDGLYVGDRKVDATATFNIEGNQVSVCIVLPSDLLGTEDTVDASVRSTMAALDYDHFFTSSYWISRPNAAPYGLSLQINPKFNAQWDFRQQAWNVLIARHRNDVDGPWPQEPVWRPYIKNETQVSSLRDQFLCHTMAGEMKSPWNIEPLRPYVGLNACIAAVYNPV